VTRSGDSYTRDNAIPGPDLAYSFSPPNPKVEDQRSTMQEKRLLSFRARSRDSKRAAAPRCMMRCLGLL
jgi:hypothetical protein